MRLGRVSATAVATALLVAGCSAGSSTSTGSTATKRSSTTTAGAPSTTAAPSVIPASAGMPAFYAVPQPVPAKPGTLIKSQKVASALHGTTYRVMYTSTTVTGAPTPVTGIVVVPNSPAPASGYPVITWGHGTNGMADICAPSLDPASAVPLADDLLDHGWEVVASDYQGEGTPGLLPYIAGDSAARNTIDIVRAARHLAAAHASADYVAWGHSEGGQTALFGLEIGPTYAPELHLKGVVAGAPPSQFNLIYSFLKTSPFRYYLLMAAGGLNAAYGDHAAPLDEVLTAKGRSLVPELDKACTDVLSRKFGSLDVSTLTVADPFTVPKWRTILKENDPEQFAKASPVPLLMIQGGSDEQIPVVSTELLAKHLCGIGQDLERWIYPGRSHSGVIEPSAPDMVHWIADRFAGGTDPDQYDPTGQTGIQVTTCPGS